MTTAAISSLGGRIEAQQNVWTIVWDNGVVQFMQVQVQQSGDVAKTILLADKNRLLGILGAPATADDKEAPPAVAAQSAAAPAVVAPSTVGLEYIAQSAANKAKKSTWKADAPKAVLQTLPPQADPSIATEWMQMVRGLSEDFEFVLLRFSPPHKVQHGVENGDVLEFFWHTGFLSQHTTTTHLTKHQLAVVHFGVLTLLDDLFKDIRAVRVLLKK